MKVAILNIYQGMVERGAEILVDNVASGLAQDFEITIFAGGKSPKKPYKTVVLPVWNLSVDVSRSVILRILHKFYLDPYPLEVFWFTLLCIPRLIKGKFDVVISINGFWQLILLRLLKIITGVKIISTGFAGVGRDAYWNSKLTTDGFIGMTNFVARWAAKINPKVKIFAIGGGVDFKRFTPVGPKAEVGLEKPVVLCVSALVPYKRVNLAIKAVSKLGKGLPVGRQGSLLVIGDGPEKKNLEKLGKKLLGERRFKILKVPYSEIDKYYRACDVFTLPSEDSEAFGIVYLEAMAAGIPVVAPNDEVRDEVVNGAGVLVNVENIEEYAEGLKLVLEKKWEDLLYKQAAKFSWDKIVEKYRQMLRTT